MKYYFIYIESSKYKIVSVMRNELLDILNCIGIEDRSHTFHPTILYSLPGCGEQCPHYDYNTDSGSINDCYVALVALDDDSRLLIIDYDGRKVVNVHLNAGDIIIMRGGTCHAGAHYQMLNIRLHYYIDPRDRRGGIAPRNENTTYFDDRSTVGYEAVDIFFSMW